MTQIGAIFTHHTPALPLMDYPEKSLSPVTLATLVTLETDSVSLNPGPPPQRLAHDHDKAMAPAGPEYLQNSPKIRR